MDRGCASGRIQPNLILHLKEYTGVLLVVGHVPFPCRNLMPLHTSLLPVVEGSRGISYLKSFLQPMIGEVGTHKRMLSVRTESPFATQGAPPPLLPCQLMPMAPY